PSHDVMYPNFNYPNNVPSGSGVGAGYPYMQQPPVLPMPMVPPVVQPMVPPGYNEEYAKWAQWNSHFTMNPSTTWRNQAAAAPRPTPYDRPVTVAHQVPYGGRPYVPRDLSGPNANTMRDSYGAVAVASTSSGPAAPTVSPWDPSFSGRPDLKSEAKAPPVPPSLNQQNAHDAYYNNVAPSLDFDVIVTSTKLDIFWKPPHVSGQVAYELSVTEGRNLPFTLEFPANYTRHTVRAKAGETYFISIAARKVMNGVTVAQGQRKIKAIFSEAELRVLYDKAVKYTGSRMHPFEILYRCKPKPYWDDIHHNCSNTMEKYMKDDNGQPANMINGVISGLFFSARLLPNGTLPCSSPFGNVRMMVQAVMILDPTNVNIYFADFYCNKQAHYVTIIVARKGSDSDIYSQKYLIQLDMRNNPWLKYLIRPDGNDWKFVFYAAHSVWVEILYTEHVPLNWGRFDKIQATGIGTSKIGGLSNNKACTICNLYPPGAADAADAAARERTRDERPRRREDDERRWEERANRSISPGLVPEDEEEEETPEFSPVNEDENLDGVELPAYEMGGNSTFQTLINIPNVHDYPNWTDCIECVCEVIDVVVTKEQQDRERQITDFNSICDSRVEKAIEEMDSIVGSCDDDKIHDLAGEMHELHDWWKRARDKLSKLLEARETREQKARADLAAAQAPPPAARSEKKGSREDEDLDEYLEDDNVITTKSAAKPTTNLTPSAMFSASRLVPPTPPTPSSRPLPTPTVTAIPLPATVPPTTTHHQSPSATVTPQKSTVAPSEQRESAKARKKKERKAPAKMKEEELDEYLDDEVMVTLTSSKDTVVLPSVDKDPWKLRGGGKDVKKDEEAVTVVEPTIRDVLNDSATSLDLSLFDETGGASMLVAPATTTKKKDTVARKSIEGEDEWLEEEDTVDLKRSMTDPGPSVKPEVDEKRVRKEELEVIDLTEDELLGGSEGDGSLSNMDITAEMEEELLREDS
ncbi:hypothetical protein PENTCL1PPCAC_21875, partial [Pristionchus entomophagus]